MSKEIKNKMVPKLRFPEFRDEKGWERRSFIDIADKDVKWSFTGGPFGSNLKASDYVLAGVRVIQLQNIGDGEFIDEYKIFTSEEKADELLSCNIYPGEIILSKMGDPVGRACLIPNTETRYVMCSDGIRLVVNGREYNNYFVFSLINSSSFRKLVEKTATGSTRKRIGLEELKNLPIILPNNPEEQQKIAYCLSSLDDLITAENQKLEALKAHKNGLMQQLFPAEGKKVPELRFEEFKKSGEWEEKALGEIGEPLMCKRIFKEETTSSSTNAIPFYKIGTFGKEADSYIPIELYEEYKSKYSFPKIGDILISASGTIGRLVVFDGSAGYFQDSNIIWLGNDEERVLNKFLFFYYSTLNWQTSDGGVIKRLYNSDFKSMSICYPKNKDEQEKIADCLSSIDNLITSQAQKIEALKEHKKGLMQDLFPNLT